jgi:VWFA-related protein
LLQLYYNRFLLCNGLDGDRIAYTVFMPAFFLIFLPLFGLAQENTTFSTDVKVVNILANVRNAKGQIVSSLNKEDFSIDEEGRPQVIKYFTRETNLPLTLGLLVDTSMSQRKVLGAEQQASITFLRQVLREAKDQAFVIHFDRDVELLQDLTSSRQKLEKALEQLQLPQQLRRGGPGGTGRPSGNRQGGGTALYDSVLLAAREMMSKETGRKAVVILSDGVDNGSKVELAEAIESAQKADLLVYTILFSDETAYGAGSPGPAGRGRGGMGSPRGGRMPPPNRSLPNGRKVMQQLANETGGAFFEVSKKLPIEQTFDRIQEQLRNQYSLGYVSDKPAGDGAFRPVHVAVKEKGLVVQARAGYFPK